MKKYKNLSGNSGIIAYESGDNYIVLKFKDGVYLYDDKDPGIDHVEQMKILAAAGKGLATYINTHIRESYRKKLG